MLIYDSISIFIFVIIGKITYLKDLLRNMVSYNNKRKKKIELTKSTVHRSIGKSYIIKEIKMLIKVPVFFMQCVFPVLILLVSIILLMTALLPIMEQIIQQDEEIRNFIQNLSFNTEIVCYILILLQVLFSISNISLTAISRDGKNAIFMKYIPIELYKQFKYKNIPQIMLNFIITLVILGIVYYIMPEINAIYLIVTFIIAVFINFINSYLMLIVDLRRPNLDWDTEYAVVKKSDNKFFQYAFMIANILLLMYFVKIFESLNTLFALIAEAIIFAIIFIIIDRCVKKWQNKLFNKIL